MINRLDRVVLQGTALTALIAVLGMTFLFTALGLYQIVNNFQVTPRFSTLISFAPTLWISLLPFSLPVSVLFAASMVMGRMRAENELLLLAASGVAPWRPFVALAPLGIVTAALSGFAVSDLGPSAYLERDNLQRKALADFIDHPPQGPRELRFADSGVDFSYSRFEGGHFEDLSLMHYGRLAPEQEEGLLALLTARRARIVYMRQSRILLLTGCVQVRLVRFDPGTGAPVEGTLVAERMNELRVPFEFGATVQRNPPKSMPTQELLRRAGEELARPGRRGACGEIVRRAGLTGAGLWLPLLGALLAALVSHPNRLLAIGAGVVPSALVYYPAVMACQNLAEAGTLHPLAASLAPALIACACIAILMGVHWRRGWA